MKEKHNENCCTACEGRIRKETFDKCLQVAKNFKYQYEKREKITTTSLILSLIINIIAISGLIIMLLR